MTNKTMEGRALNGAGYSTQVFGAAIAKYGWENFEHEVLFEHLSIHEAAFLETRMIEQYKSNKPEYGYNQTKGGEIGYVKPRVLKKPVCFYSGYGDGIKFYKEYSSVTEAAKAPELPSKTTTYNISSVCTYNMLSLTEDEDLKRYGGFLMCYSYMRDVMEARITQFRKMDKKPE